MAPKAQQDPKVPLVPTVPTAPKAPKAHKVLELKALKARQVITARRVDQATLRMICLFSRTEDQAQAKLS
jgi:hypothetical protein